jgi:hypothetical protein
MKSQLIFGAIVTAVLASPASAGTRDDILSHATRCNSITDDHTWLNCYYGAAQPMRAHLGLPPAPESQTLLVPSGAGPVPVGPQMAPIPPPRPQKENDGLSYILGGTVVLSRVPAAAYSFGRNGIFKITLSDGSVWQQIEGDANFAQWREPANHYLVSVTKGSLGSFNLQVNGDNKSYKVRQLS